MMFYVTILACINSFYPLTARKRIKEIDKKCIAIAIINCSKMLSNVKSVETQKESKGHVNVTN